MKTAIILIHGFLGSPHDFDAIIPMLNTLYDRIELLTIPGHSSENAFKSSEFTEEATFKYVLDTFDEIAKDYETIDVAGFSLGGSLAVYLSQERDFRRLVLLAPALKYFNPKLLNYRFKYIISRRIKIGKARLTKKYENVEELQVALKNVMYDDKISFKFAKDNFIKIYLYKAYRSFKKITKKCFDRLDNGDIKNNTLILWGTIDQLVPKSSIDFVTSHCSDNVEVCILEGVSHLLLLSYNPDDMIEKILNFLTK